MPRCQYSLHSSLRTNQARKSRGWSNRHTVSQSVRLWRLLSLFPLIKGRLMVTRWFHPYSNDGARLGTLRQPASSFVPGSHRSFSPLPSPKPTTPVAGNQSRTNTYTAWQDLYNTLSTNSVGPCSALARLGLAATLLIRLLRVVTSEALLISRGLFAAR